MDMLNELDNIRQEILELISYDAESLLNEETSFNIFKIKDNFKKLLSPMHSNIQSYEKAVPYIHECLFLFKELQIKYEKAYIEKNKEKIILDYYTSPFELKYPSKYICLN